MSANGNAAALVRKWEGCHLRAYPDPASGGDPWTIGFGATGLGIRRGVVWTQQRAEQRLELDVKRFVDGVRRLLQRPATDKQLGAMASLAYNIGLDHPGRRGAGRPVHRAIPRPGFGHHRSQA